MPDTTAVTQPTADSDEPWRDIMPPSSVRTPEDHARWETCCELAWKMIYAEYPERLTQMANTLYYSDIPTL